MNTLGKTTKYLLLTLVLLGGALLLFTAGLGTGLYVAQTTAVSARATETATLIPTATWTVPPSPTATPQDAFIPEPTQTPAVLQPTVQPPTATPLPPPTSTRSAQAPVDMDIFWEAWEILNQEFYGDLPTESELPYAALRGVIASTGDPYTVILDPQQAEIVRTDMSGSFEGIGATVRVRPDGKFEIVQPMAGYPAIQAGLRPNDMVVEVDGVSIEGMSIYEAISLIRGPAGTIVHLLIEREGVDEPFIIEIERARIELPVVESEMLDNDIAYVRLTEFGQTATAKLQEALQEVLAEEPVGLIFDLRDNPGGYLDTAIEVSSQFVGSGPILFERFSDGQERSFPAQPGGLALDIPLVVLVNGGTASASEIVAGAIQDTERGILIGTKTLGKGSVQLVHTLSNESQLRVTIARWFTPNDRAIHGEGLAPDIEVIPSEIDLEAEWDSQLQRAIDYLLEGR